MTKRFVIQTRARLDGGDDATAAFGPWAEHSRHETDDAANAMLTAQRDACASPAGWLLWRKVIEPQAHAP